MNATPSWRRTHTRQSKTSPLAQLSCWCKDSGDITLRVPSPSSAVASELGAIHRVLTRWQQLGLLSRRQNESATGGTHIPAINSFLFPVFCPDDPTVFRLIRDVANVGSRVPHDPWDHRTLAGGLLAGCSSSRRGHAGRTVRPNTRDRWTVSYQRSPADRRPILAGPVVVPRAPDLCTPGPRVRAISHGAPSYPLEVVVVRWPA